MILRFCLIIKRISFLSVVIPDTPACCATHILSKQHDFLNQKNAIHEAVEDRNHKFELYPKYHCECNFIERYWGAAKRMAREQCDYTFASLQKKVPQILDEIPLSMIRKFSRKAWRYIDAYHKGLNGMEAEKSVKKYKSHRRIGIND